MKNKDQKKDQREPKKVSVIPYFMVIVVAIALGILFRYTQLP